MRWAGVIDAAGLAALNDDFNGELRRVADIEQSLLEGSELVAVVVVKGELVGFACAQIFRSFCYSHAQGEITEMYMKENFRGNGHAKMLLAFLETELYEQGVEEVKIITGKSNVHAQKFYERSKYVPKEYIAFQKNRQEQM
ncbi:GNAT family N-acetyltransferase [Paenibacillus paeoniae]|uniref:GNAT family N-acetyltransferase n=1 Tax=Paenibacillus paeoniae TaxID=2292705 RepID=A0A371PHC2_9BACL|nr:GNAT family N-acetyltransferase [Paenibacillus paeoniae]REK75026.1 GNAT family N-acetyltransferase [Paenibacillus paeoniae]